MSEDLRESHVSWLINTATLLRNQTRQCENPNPLRSHHNKRFVNLLWGHTFSFEAQNVITMSHLEELYSLFERILMA